MLNYQGSMMAHAAQDFLFWAALTVAAQDSIWATGSPNMTDLCLRCHMPGGWLEGRSDPTNASAMTGTDFDGLQCEFCHRMFDPFFESTYQGNESNDWLNYWDETNWYLSAPRLLHGVFARVALGRTGVEAELEALNPTIFLLFTE